MRGRVWKRGKVWYVRYDAGTDERGRRLQPCKGGFATEREAEEYLALRLAEVATGRHVAPTRQTFGELAIYWRDVVMPRRTRPTTRESYLAELHTHLLPAFGHLPIQAIRAGHVDQFLTRCERAGLAPRTVHHLHGRLSQIFRVAVRERLIARSVMEDVRPPRIAPTEMHVWTAEQLDTFLTRVEDSRFGVLWHTYAMTGMRRGEALGLRWADVDWERRRLHVRQQVIIESNTIQFGPPKTALGTRAIAVGPRTMELLAAHRARQNRARLAAKSWTDLDLVFAREPFLQHTDAGPGTPWNPRVISNYWRITAAATGLPRIRLHDLRHTHATIMIAEDGNVKEIAARLGHDPAMLLRTYAHSMPETADRAVSRFEAALTRGRERRQMAGSAG